MRTAKCRDEYELRTATACPDFQGDDCHDRRPVYKMVEENERPSGGLAQVFIIRPKFTEVGKGRHNLLGILDLSRDTLIDPV